MCGYGFHAQQLYNTLLSTIALVVKFLQSGLHFPQTIRHAELVGQCETCTVCKTSLPSGRQVVIMSTPSVNDSAGTHG